MSGFLGGIASAIGGYLSNQQTIAANWRMLKESERFNHSEGVINRDYQTEMSNTSYQRGMADMRKAGLNPMLAFERGGASTPTGNAPSVGAPTISGLRNWIGDGVTTALDAYRSLSQVKQQEANTDLIKAQEEKTRAETLNTPLSGELLSAQRDEARGRTQPEGTQEAIAAARMAADRGAAAAGNASAGASSAQARLTAVQEDSERWRLGFRRSNNADPATAQGYTFGPVSIPPPSQTGNQARRLWDGVSSAFSFPSSAYQSQTAPLSAAQRNVLEPIVRGSQSRERAQSGNSIWIPQLPNQPVE